MLKGIHPIVSPELLKILAEMGHGDEIVLADAHFPGHTFCPKNVLRGDGLQIPDLLEGIIPLFELDSYDDPLIMMAAVEGDQLDPQVEIDYMAAIRKNAPDAPAPVRIDRFAFYDRAEKAYACVITGTTAKYGNIILKKGVTPADQSNMQPRSVIAEHNLSHREAAGTAAVRIPGVTPIGQSNTQPQPVIAELNLSHREAAGTAAVRIPGVTPVGQSNM